MDGHATSTLTLTSAVVVLAHGREASTPEGDLVSADRDATEREPSDADGARGRREGVHQAPPQHACRVQTTTVRTGAF